MPENTKESADSSLGLPDDEVESAKILLREGLVEEAKRTLYRTIGYHPHHVGAKKFLKQIQDLESKALFQQPAKKVTERISDPDAVIQKLELDLGLEPVLGEAALVDEQLVEQRWSVSGELSDTERFDLAVAFYEMGCYGDALRELERLERKVRIESSFLSTFGVSVIALKAQCWVGASRPFDAKMFLEPILAEPELKHEDKLTLYYCMGICEQSLGNAELALGWYQKIFSLNQDFQDIRFRIRQLK